MLVRLAFQERKLHSDCMQNGAGRGRFDDEFGQSESSEPMTSDAGRPQDRTLASDGAVPAEPADDGMENVFPNPKSHAAYELLHRAIREGRYAPGVRLKEVDLAANLGMSRTPIREALRQLQRDGIVTVTPHRGAVVRKLSEQEIDDTYSLRAVLEGFCASRAAVRMDRAELVRLQEICEAFETQIDQYAGRPEDVEILIRLNKSFHDAIAAGSKNARVTEILQRAAEVPVHMKQVYWQSERSRSRAIVHHGEIRDALMARDAVRADAVMRTHVYSVKDFFMQQYRLAVVSDSVSSRRRANGGDSVISRDQQ